jgi:hypothetical protein
VAHQPALAVFITVLKALSGGLPPLPRAGVTGARRLLRPMRDQAALLAE